MQDFIYFVVLTVLVFVQMFPPLATSRRLPALIVRVVLSVAIGALLGVALGHSLVEVLF